MVDSHEMGSHDSYLFSPPRHPFNPFRPPSHRDWGSRFAAEQARALDARGRGGLGFERGRFRLGGGLRLCQGSGELIAFEFG